MTAQNTTALIDKAVLIGARPMGRPLRQTVGGIIGELLAQGIKCSGLKKDQSAFTDHSYLLIRGRIQLAVRFLKGLTHFYSLLITISEDFDPHDPDGCISIIVDRAPVEDARMLFGAYVEEMLAEFDNAYILLLEKLSDHRSISSALDDVIRSGRPLLIVVADVESEALSMLLPDCVQAGLKIAVVKAPGFGDRRKAMLEDIAIRTGSRLISGELGNKLDCVTIDMLGHAGKVVIDKQITTIANGGGKKKDLDAHVLQIKTQIAEATSDYEREKLHERLVRLAAAIIRVGGVQGENFAPPLGATSNVVQKASDFLATDNVRATGPLAPAGATATELPEVVDPALVPGSGGNGY